MSIRPEFWSRLTAAPKRKYMFQVYAAGLPAFLCYSSNKPEITFSTTKVNFLNHEFKYPGRVTYNDLELKYYDTQDPNGSTAKLIYKTLLDSGYVRPENAGELSTVSKRKAVQPLQNAQDAGTGVQGFRIEHIDEEGSIIEEWTLINPWISKCNFGDVDYGSDEAVSLSMTIVYDYPKLIGV